MKFYLYTYEYCCKDLRTSKVLEIVEPGTQARLNVASRNSAHANSTLLSVLNRTLTLSGHRLLKSTIMQPSTDLSLIEARFEAIDELLAKPYILYYPLCRLLPRLADIDSILNGLLQEPLSDPEVSFFACIFAYPYY